MTRFARAKGAKASNLKTAEDSTPWEIMKEQLLKSKQEGEQSKKREEAEKQRIENYNNFLKEHKIKKRKVTWCEFPESETKKAPKNVPSLREIEKETEAKKQKKKYNIHQSSSDTIDEKSPKNEDIISSDTNTQKKTKKKNLDEKSNVSENKDMNEVKVKKNKKKNKNVDCIAKKNEIVNVDNDCNSTSNNKSKAKNKNKLNNQPKRKKPYNDKSFELIINGKEIDLERFDGFPIMKKDAERLRELKSYMIKKGIPKSEVQRNLKLERRRAEKALARLKRDVCYNCRKGGHNLSDCPDLKTNVPGNEAADGVCFKCGSTEHRQFECKVQRDKEFRFATCFICKESGHIARQCPDNPKGLYPNGGCCKLCGDVTHLKKDCHTIKDKKVESTIKLSTINNNDVEDIGLREVSTAPEVVQKQPKKIKF